MHSTVRTTTQGTSVDRSRKLLRKMNHHESMLLAGTWVLMRYPTPIYLWEEKKKKKKTPIVFVSNRTLTQVKLGKRFP